MATVYIIPRATDDQRGYHYAAARRVPLARWTAHGIAAWDTAEPAPRADVDAARRESAEAIAHEIHHGIQRGSWDHGDYLVLLPDGRAETRRRPEVARAAARHAAARAEVDRLARERGLL